MTQSFPAAERSVVYGGQNVAPGYGGVTTVGGPYYGEYPQVNQNAFTPYPVKPMMERPRLSFTAIGASLFVPWAIFIVTYLVVSFEWHARQFALMQAICGILLAFVLILGALAVYTAVSGRGGRTWAFFLFFTALIAWVAGVVAGQYNYAFNLRPYYDVTSLNVYPSVDPNLAEGQQIMDAGRIIFEPTSHVDLTRSMGFQNRETYCVAPIVSNSTLPASYDFWAVGINCCGTGGFTCGDARNPHAHAGLRLMRDDQRPFFRLAVQQAEAQFNVRANHPIFLTWIADPMSEINAFEDNGLRFFVIGIFIHLAAQFFLVVVAALTFAKLGV